eukprot:9448035-Pyramimonas_sp.AAC.1
MEPDTIKQNVTTYSAAIRTCEKCEKGKQWQLHEGLSVAVDSSERREEKLEPSTLAHEACEKREAKLEPDLLAHEACEKWEAKLEPEPLAHEACEKSEATLEPVPLAHEACEKRVVKLEPFACSFSYLLVATAGPAVYEKVSATCVREDVKEESKVEPNAVSYRPDDDSDCDRVFQFSQDHDEVEDVIKKA